jgi:acyl carrier protein
MSTPSASDVSAAIRQYIVTTWLSGDARGFTDDTDLQESGILDSFSTLALVGHLDETFQTRLDPADVNTETFRTIKSLTALVLSKLG